MLGEEKDEHYYDGDSDFAASSLLGFESQIISALLATQRIDSANIRGNRYSESFLNNRNALSR